MVEAMYDLALKAKDETNQMRVKGALMKITKKPINIFLAKK